MKTFGAIFLFLFSIPASTISAQHTTCYNYFLQKDGCVHSASSSQERCQAPPKHFNDGVEPFVHRDHNQTQTGQDRQPIFPIASGTGICGPYDSTQELGICLWSGAEQSNPSAATAGWLNGAKVDNCDKRVYVQRRGQPKTVQFAKVIDGCSFNVQSPETGCFQIGLSLALFEALNPTEEERAHQLIYDGISWDFDNLLDQDPAQSPA